MRSYARILMTSAAAAAVTAAFAAPSLAQSNDELRRQLDAAQARIQSLEGRLAADLPPATEDGECYARLLIPPAPQVFTETIVVEPERTETIFIEPTYETVTERVVIEDERIETRVIPAVTETVTEEVLVQPERVVRRVIPAVTEMVTEQVLVTPERVERRVIPATYRTITETVTITEERIEPVVMPAEYEEYTEQVLVRDAYYTWQPAEPLFASADTGAQDVATFVRQNFDRTEIRELATGEILCRVEVPAEYETVTRTRLVQPERIMYRTVDGELSPDPVTLPAITETVTRQELITAEQIVEDVIPAVYEDVTREVVVEPERVVEETIPAEFEMVTRSVVVEPERVEEVVIPEVFENIQTRRLVTPGREEVRTIPAITRDVTRTRFVGENSVGWREVLCEINTTPEAIATIQRALRDAGYNPGRADGVFDAGTYEAMTAYQEANGLAVGNLTRDFVEHLGVPWEPLTVNFYDPSVR